MKPRLQDPSSSLEQPQKVKVTDKANRLRLAVVLDTREDTNGNREYYVHYDGQDRRHDEWVGEKRVKKKFRNDKNSAEERGEKKRPSRKSVKSPAPQAAPVNYDEVLHKQHEEATKVKYIETVRYGNFELDTWYFSPYPDEYGRTRYLYVCDRCMRFAHNEISHRKHLGECCAKSPPGTAVYVDREFSIYEVSGKDESFFCQCLCLFAKLFLDDKTILFHTSGFLFYVLCMQNNGVPSIAGFFSKELRSEDGCNLNCLLVLPQFQRRGFGKLLIQLSYEISIKEGLIGSPEKPLSDMGMNSYRSYWAYVIVSQMMNKMDREALALSELSRLTHIALEDLVATVEWLGLETSDHRVFADELHTTFARLKELSKTVAKPPTLLLNRRLLRWK